MWCRDRAGWNLLLGEGSIGPKRVGYYCGLVTIEFVFGDGIKKNFKVAEDQYQYGDWILFPMDANWIW